MPLLRPNRLNSARWRILLALLCVVLALVAGTAQAVHSHNDSAALHPDCSLCVAAHASVHVVSTPAPAPATAIAAAPERTEPTRPAQPLFVFALFNRPPPAA